jgi:hypothetical protein
MGPPVGLSAWHHLAVVTRTGETTLFFDGSEVASDYLQLDTPKSQAFAIGANWEGRAFKGAIDELAVYSRALTALEVRRIFLAGSAGKCPPL